MPTTLVRLPARLVGAALVGALVGAVGSGVHQLVGGERRWPVGLAVALALTALWGLVLGRRPGPAAVRVAGTLGWVVVVAAVSMRRPEGDVLVPGNARGYSWMLIGFAVLLATVVLPARAAAQARG